MATENRRSFTGWCSAHTLVGMAVLVVDLGFVAAILILNQTASPPTGNTDTSSPLGWVSTLGAVFAFGCYGILIKTPSVSAANVDTMVFQIYYSAGVILISMVIWSIDADTTFVFSWWGTVAAACWVAGQIVAYVAIQALGYAIAPAIWAGTTIVVSFFWGSFAFGDNVRSAPGAAIALLLLVAGICIVAASGSTLPKRLRARFAKGTEGEIEESECLVVPVDSLSEAGHTGRATFMGGVLLAIIMGLMNGSLMVPVQCFSRGGCLVLPEAYDGGGNASVAFLPSLSIGIAIVTPVFFFAYFLVKRLMFGPDQGRPRFHTAVAALPGLVTGVYWGCGNFASFFATAYLGQTIGFPLTQTCIVLNGFWGIAYYKEIKGVWAIGVFAVGVVLVLVGAILDGSFG